VAAIRPFEVVYYREILVDDVEGRVDVEAWCVEVREEEWHCSLCNKSIVFGGSICEYA